MKRSFIKYICSMLLFGLNGIVAAHIGMSSYEIVLMRTLLGSLLLLAVFLLSRRRFTFFRHRRQSVFLAISGIAMGASWMFLYEAYRQIGVSVASLTYYCGPVIVMALAPVLFREKLTWPRLAGFAAVLAGIFLVNGRLSLTGNAGWGLFCGAMSAVTYAAMVICNKKAKDIRGLENSLLQLLAAFITVALFVCIKQGLAIAIAPADWPWILVLGLINTGLGCYWYFSSIGGLPVQTVAVCGYLEPLGAVLFSVLLMGETLLPQQIAGAALIIGGAVAAEVLGGKRAARA